MIFHFETCASNIIYKIRYNITMNFSIDSKTNKGLFMGLVICTLGSIIANSSTWTVSADSCYARGPNFDLHGCNFTSADLSNLNLFGVNLSGANLFGANLSGTNLSNANLLGANLSYTDLANTDFTNANLGGISYNGCIGTPIGTPAQGTLPTC